MCVPFDALQAYYDLFDLIDKALHKADPKIDNKPSNRDFPSSHPWWNDECTKIERLRKAKLSRYRHVSSYENYLDLQKFEAISKRTFKKTKILGWKSFCETLSHNSKLSNVCNTIKGFRHRFLSYPSPTTANNNT